MLEEMFKALSKAKRGPEVLKSNRKLMSPGMYEGISAIFSGILNNTE